MRLSPLSQVRSAITGKNRFPVTIRQIHVLAPNNIHRIHCPFCICLPGGIAPEMLPGSNTRRLLEPWPRALVNVIIDPLLSGPKELEKVNSPVFAGLINA